MTYDTAAATSSFKNWPRGVSLITGCVLVFFFTTHF